LYLTAKHLFGNVKWWIARFPPGCGPGSYLGTQLLRATRKLFEGFILVYQMSREENPDSQKYAVANGARIDNTFVVNFW